MNASKINRIEQEIMNPECLLTYTDVFNWATHVGQEDFATVLQHNDILFLPTKGFIHQLGLKLRFAIPRISFGNEGLQTLVIGANADRVARHLEGVLPGEITAEVFPAYDGKDDDYRLFMNTVGSYGAPLVVAIAPPLNKDSSPSYPAALYDMLRDSSTQMLVVIDQGFNWRPPQLYLPHFAEEIALPYASDLTVSALDIFSRGTSHGNFDLDLLAKSERHKGIVPTHTPVHMRMFGVTIYDRTGKN